MRFVGVRLVATWVALVGSVNLLTSVRPHARLARFAAPMDGGIPGRAQAFVVGLLLIVIARALIARRYAAWATGVVVLAVAASAAIPHHRIAVALAGASLVALVALRHDFPARPDPARLRLAGQIGLVAIASAVIGGGWDLVANRHDPADVGTTVVGYLSTDAPTGWRAWLVTFVIAGSAVLAVVVAFLPAAPPKPGSPVDRAEVTELAARGDADSLAPFATRADKSYVFSPDRRAALGYRVLFGTALVGGDPVGSVDSAGGAVKAYLELCTQHGWRPAVLGASDDTAPLWRRYGLHGLHIGDEAVLAVDEFSLASRRMRNVRQAVNRTRNAGVTVSIGPLTADLATDLRPVLDQWLGGRRERGFAMNLDAILAPRPDCLFAVAYTAGGEAAAFARFAVCADGSIYTLDVAPRGILAPNGVAERMIVDVVDYARAHGAREVSLNFAAFRWVFDAPGAMARTGAALLHAFDRWIEIASLNRFCEKFQPRWRARSLLTPSWPQMGWVAAAAVRAELVPRQWTGADPPSVRTPGIATVHRDDEAAAPDPT
ncbi:MAG TPA: phosphatidylglycerol lysyltransferase domain-containing protein [Micromonosporaceae bacterium]